MSTTPRQGHTLLVGHRDVIALLPMSECIDAMTEALRTLARGGAILPLRQIVRLPDGRNAFGLMPAVIDQPLALGAKVITVFPGNDATPYDSHQGAVLLFDTVHGSLIAIIDASTITGLRTAAVTAVATRLLSRPESRTLALLGAGVQAVTHLESISLVRPIDQVRVWSRSGDRARRFAERAAASGVRIVVCGTAREAVDGADIVCTVTSSREPVLARDWLAPGAHVNAVGASLATSRELDSATVAAARLYVDRRESAINEAGDFLVPKREGLVGDDHIVGEIGELLVDPPRIEGRRSPGELTVFKSLGLAIEDVAAARRIYDRAVAEHVGSWVDLGDSAMPTPDQITINDVRAARERLAGIVVRTPLVRLELSGAAGDIWLKLENLQPIGSFKLRGAANAMLLAGRERLAHGAYTASAGNMAQGVAWSARRLGVSCTVVVPDHAPQTKVDAIERLGGRVVRVSYDQWWQTMIDHSFPGIDGLFVHPVSDPAVVAGNGTIGLEIIEDLPDVDTILVPFGGGGLSSGIATAIRALKPNATVFGCEVATSTPLTAALAAGEPRRVERTPSFVDGIGGMGVLADMWPLVSTLLSGALVSSVEQVADAVRLLAERARVVAEGAGAAALAAALGHRVGGKVVCVVSGGNIDSAKLATILGGKVPT